MHCNRSRKNLISLIVAAGAGLGAFCPTAVAETRHLSFAIEDTVITLVDKQTYHTFSFNGQMPDPFIHVTEGDDLEISVEQQHDAAAHCTLARYLSARYLENGRRSRHNTACIVPGETFTYRFNAEPSGTLWYHCHVNVNEHVGIRGMWGPMIVDPNILSPSRRQSPRTRS